MQGHHHSCRCPDYVEDAALDFPKVLLCQLRDDCLTDFVPRHLRSLVSKSLLGDRPFFLEYNIYYRP